MSLIKVTETSVRESFEITDLGKETNVITKKKKYMWVTVICAEND